MKIKYLTKEARYYKKLKSLKRMLIKFSLAKTPLSSIVNTKMYNMIYASRIKDIMKRDANVLQIENTSFCNARCIMCPHVHMKRKAKTMNFNDFKKIVDNVLNNIEIKIVTITGFGEPFIDKGIIDKIEYVNKAYPKLGVDIYSNASLLTQELTNELLKKTKIHKINFSLNGTEKTYKRIMGLDYEKTKNNVLYFLEKRGEMKKKILVNISLMIMKENQKDIENFIEFWYDKADSVMVYAPSNWAGTHNINYVTKSPFKKKRWACPPLWKNVTVDVDGNVIMCCRDYESKVKFGNLKKSNIKEIINSERFKDIKKRHLTGDFDMEICKNCDNSFDSSLDWWA